MYPKRLLKPSLILALLLVTLSSVLGVAISRASTHQRIAFLPVIQSQRSAPPPATSTPPPAPAGEVVARGFINSSRYEGPFEIRSYYAYGEVINNLDVPVYDVELMWTFRNAAGETLGTDTGGAMLPRIEARSSVPLFKWLSGSNVPQDIAQYTIEVTSWETQGSPNIRPVTILSTNVRVGSSGLVTVVDGEGRNTTEKPLANIVLVVSFRNSAGEVVYASWIYPVGFALPPGRTFRYIHEAAPPEYARYSVQVQGIGY